MYEDLKQIANLEFGKAVERLSREKEQNLRATRALPRGGQALKNVLDIELEYGEKISQAYAKIWLDLLEEKNGGILTREHINFILGEIRTITATRKATLLSGPRPGSVHLASAGGEIARSTDRIVASISRDLEIRIRRQEVGLSKEPKPQDRFNVTIQNAANVNLGSQVGTINATLNAVAEQSQAHKELAAAIRELSNSILKSQALKDDDKQAAFQVISTLVSQAQIGPEERSKGTLKALVAGFTSIIGTAADVTTLWSAYAPVIRTFFGL